MASTGLAPFMSRANPDLTVSIVFALPAPRGPSAAKPAHMKVPPFPPVRLSTTGPPEIGPPAMEPPEMGPVSSGIHAIRPSKAPSTIFLGVSWPPGTRAVTHAAEESNPSVWAESPDIFSQSSRQKGAFDAPWSPSLNVSDGTGFVGGSPEVETPPHWRSFRAPDGRAPQEGESPGQIAQPTRATFCREKISIGDKKKSPEASRMLYTRPRLAYRGGLTAQCRNFGGHGLAVVMERPRRISCPR